MSDPIIIGGVTLDPKEGYLWDTIATSSICDSAAETLDINGLDLSSWDEGRGYVNWDHAQDGPSKQVGRVLYYKKIFTKEDCDNDRELLYWDRTGEHPYVYAVCQLFDAANHPEAISLAAIMRAQTKDGPTHKIGTSIEGSTIARDEKNPTILRETIGRNLAVTIKPANKVCHVGTLADDQAPEAYKPKKEEKDLLAEIADSKKSETPFNNDLINFGSEFVPDSFDNIAKGLNKAMSVGNTNAAPSTLTGGAALAREDIMTTHRSVLKSILRDWGKRDFNKDEFKVLAKNKLPDVSDEFIDHFVDAIDEYHIKNKVLKAEPEFNLNEFKYKLDYIDIELKKAINNLQIQNQGLTLPSIYNMSVKVGDDFHPAGRFMYYNNKLTHLEDYHGLLGNLIPEGPVDEAGMARLNGLMKVPDVKIQASPLSFNDKETAVGGVPEEDQEAEDISLPEKYPVVQPSVFIYHRLGMKEPITLECHNGEYLANGIKLTPEELQVIIDNLDQEVATIRYKNDVSGNMSKMEDYLKDLVKAEEEMDPDNALQAIRAAVKAGHVHPSVERVLTRQIFQDSMGPIGNKYAYNKYIEKHGDKPGIHVAADANSFREINNNFGHHVGDEAIKTLANLSREAMDETMGGEKAGKVFRTGTDPENEKVFRPGGDEFNYAGFPSHEHAVRFIRTMNKKLDALPPINGVHKLSMSFGIGHTPKVADDALYQAKSQKSSYKVGKIPNLSHSLVPGSEGAIPVADPGQAAVHHVLSQAQQASAA